MQLRAYREEGGLDRDWEEQMATLLGVEDASAEKPPAPAPAPGEDKP